MNKSTKSLLLAALIALAPAAYAQAQLTNGVPDASDAAVFAGGIFNLPTDSIPSSGSAPFGDPTGAALNQVNVGSGGNLPASFLDQEIHFSEVNINSGGDTSNSLHFFNSEVNVLAGGEIGALYTVEASSTLNVADGAGSIGSNVDIFGTANISGGRSSGNFDTFAGSTVNIGGTADIDGSNTNDFAGVVNISGDAQISTGTDFEASSNVTVSGGTFASNIDFFGTNNFTGGDFGGNFILREGATAVFDDTDGGVTIASGGQIRGQATINGGDFTASLDFDPGSAGSVVNGGTFGANVDISDDITINGGTFGANLDVGIGSGSTAPTVTVNGGTFDEIDVDSGTVNIEGGTFLGGPTGVAISVRSAGSLDGTPVTPATVNLRGGDIQGLVEAFGDINLFGTDFAIDGTPLAGLSSFDVLDPENRASSILTGTLEDGNEIRLVLNEGFFFIDTTEPISNPLDIDGNLSTIFTDVDEGNDVFGLPGGFGGALTVNGTTINITAVPEPSSLSLLALGALGLISRRRRS